MADISDQAAAMVLASPAPAPEPIEDVVEASSFNAMLMVLLIILWSSCGHLLASRTKYIGEGSAACGMGLIMGVFIIVIQHSLSKGLVHELLTFNPADFFTYFLPPIIFYAGLSVKKKQFFRNFPTISSFGILGTYVAFATVALVLYAFAQLPNILNLSDCLALGVIFAATDSVAVLQVLQQDRMPLLYSLVFGEGVINDATSVALLRAVQDLGIETGQGLHFGTILTIFAKFVYLFAASLLLGLVFGLGTSWLLKVFKANSTPQEVTLLGLLGYLSYLCGDFLGLSGIVALFCCAVTISHYALHNVNSLSRVTTVSAFQTLSYVSEGAIFIYVGMDALDPTKWSNTMVTEMSWLFVVLLLLMGVGRAVFVFPLSFLHNWWSREKLTFRDTIVIWWAGLIRGAVSVALVYYHFDPQGKSEDAKRATLITTTLLLVLFCIMVCGALTKPLLDFMLGAEVLVPAVSKPSGSDRASRTLNGQVYAALDLPRTSSTPLAGADSQQAVQPAHMMPVVDLKVQRPRLLGSRGQDLAEMAENCPPAMVAAANPPDPSPKAVLLAIQAPQHTSSPLSHSSVQENGVMRHRRSQIEDDLLAEPTGDGFSAFANGHTQGPASPGSSQPRREAYDSRAGSHRDAGSRPPSAGRDAWQPPWNESEPAPRPLMSPFETEHAQQEGDASPLWRGGVPLQGLTSVRSLRSGSLDGNIHRWWTRFDARVMQPLFGGPRVEEPTAMVQAEGDVAPLLATGVQHHPPRAPVALARSSYGPQRPGVSIV